MIKETIGFGDTIEEARENALFDLNVSNDVDVQYEVLEMPKSKFFGIFGKTKAQVRAYIELPDEKPARKEKSQSKKNSAKEQVKKENTKREVPTKPAVKETVEKTTEPAPEMKKADEIFADSPVGRAVSYLKSVLNKFGCDDIEIMVGEKENGAVLSLSGEGLGVVIGHRGETLDALQYLVSLAANSANGYYKVTLDIGNYREKREQTLKNLANRVATQVLKTGRSRTLEPMNPYERRIIHTAVQEIEGVVSNSIGERSGRRVVISPENGEQRPQRRQNYDRRRRDTKAQAVTVADSSREPKRDAEIPLYGKIN